MNRIKNILILLPIIIISGCSVYGGDFECKMGKGVNCKSVSTLNTMIDNNTLSSDHNKKNSKHKKVQPKIINKPQPAKGFFASLFGKKQPLPSITNVARVTNMGDTVYRTREATMRIWVRPYQDKGGDYLESRYFYTVVAPATWKNVDAK